MEDSMRIFRWNRRWPVSARMKECSCCCLCVSSVDWISPITVQEPHYKTWYSICIHFSNIASQFIIAFLSTIQRYYNVFYYFMWIGEHSLLGFVNVYVQNNTLYASLRLLASPQVMFSNVQSSDHRVLNFPCRFTGYDSFVYENAIIESRPYISK